jgi:predicted RNase H-like HicB family nuclease
VPELPGCKSDGETPQQALESEYDAIACWMEAAEEMGRTIPSPKRAAA